MTHSDANPSGGSFEVDVWIDRNPDDLFSYFTEPKKLELWMAASANIDLRPGGQLRIVARRGQVVLGTILELAPPDRLVVSWGWEGNDKVPPGSTRVEIELTPEGNGTRVSLRHSGLPTAEWTERHESGWAHYLNELSRLASERLREEEDTCAG